MAIEIISEIHHKCLTCGNIEFEPGYCDWCHKKIEKGEDRFHGNMLLDRRCRNLIVKLGIEAMKQEYGVE